MFLVSGANGFVGSALVRTLAARGVPVRAHTRTGELLRRPDGANLELRGGDLRRPDELRGLCAGVDTVIHCAGRLGVWGSQRQFHENIYDATVNLLGEACGHVQRFVYVSSIAALGLAEHLTGAPESAPPRHTGMPYGDAKADAEGAVRKLHAEGRIAGVIVRPVLITGPGSPGMRDILEHMRTRRGVPLVDGGVHRAGLVYIDSVVDGLLRAAQSPAAPGNTYHLCDDWGVTWKQFLTDLGASVGLGPKGDVPFALAWPLSRALEAVYAPFGVRPPSTREIVGVFGRANAVDTSRARADLGWQTQVSYAEAMRRTGAWARAEAGASSTEPMGRQPRDARAEAAPPR